MTKAKTGSVTLLAALGACLMLIVAACQPLGRLTPASPGGSAVAPPALAAPAPPGPPTATYTYDEVIRLIGEDDGKPKLVGDFVGFRFSRQVGAHELGCEGFMTEVPLAELGESQLQLDRDSFPDGFNKLAEAASACEGVVRSHAWEYDWPGYGPVSIARFTGNSVLAVAPAERITEVPVGGRTAVLIRELPLPGQLRDPALGPFQLLLPEDFGYTIISVRGIPFEALLELAEGLR